MTLTFTNDNYLDAPFDSVRGRVIDPIHVIESWGLTHHLACALKYLCRAGHQGKGTEDLQKALWYLDRFLRRCVSGTSENYMTLPSHFRILDIALDWELGHELTRVLEHLYESTKGQSLYHIEAAQKILKRYLKNLKKKTG